MEDWIRIGVIYPASGLADFEFYKMLPDNVTVHITRVPLEKSTAECLAKLGDYVEDAASLLAQAHVKVIAFCCTAGSFIKGPTYDREIIGKIEAKTGIPAVTASSAVVSALKKLNAEKIVVATPYMEEINRLERSFLEAFGFKVLKIKGLQLPDSYAMGHVHPEELRRFVKSLYTPEADAVFISCGGLRTADLIRRLEEELGIPVVTSNQAVIWASLRRAGVRKPVKGFGKLFSL